MDPEKKKYAGKIVFPVADMVFKICFFGDTLKNGYFSVIFEKYCFLGYASKFYR